MFIQLSDLSDEQLVSLCKDVVSQLERGETPEGGAAYLEAIISEQKQRVVRLQAESDRLEGESRNKEKEIQNKEHEVENLKKICNHFKSQSSSMQNEDGIKPRRNDPCSCGSGRKYKHCCGKY